jgi:hypothetical protein
LTTTAGGGGGQPPPPHDSAVVERDIQRVADVMAELFDRYVPRQGTVKELNDSPQFNALMGSFNGFVDLFESVDIRVFDGTHFWNLIFNKADEMRQNRENEAHY